MENSAAPAEVGLSEGLAGPLRRERTDMDQGTHEAPPPIAWASDALRDVAAERRRQIEVEGWTPDHDDATHLPGELALAACCYCVADENEAPPAVGPWAQEWWKPKDRRRNMVRAAALLLAEIERHDRMEADITENADYLA